jgi:dTDP-4-dehydrorhamnose 3,5-epimerase
MIEGVIVKKLDVLQNDEGKMMRMIKSTDSDFNGFGEIYFSLVYPGKIKGWHKSNKATKRYAVVEGNITLVLFDGKNIEEINIGEKNYCLVTIPPGIWSSFCSLDGKKAIVADLLDFPFDKKDAEKISPFSLTDYWKEKSL